MWFERQHIICDLVQSFTSKCKFTGNKSRPLEFQKIKPSSLGSKLRSATGPRVCSCDAPVTRTSQNFLAVRESEFLKGAFIPKGQRPCYTVSSSFLQRTLEGHLSLFG